MFVVGVAIILFLIKSFSKNFFLKILLNTPRVGDIIRKQNSINILMLYSFYYSNSNKFFEKFKEQLHMLPMPPSWTDIPDLVSKSYRISKEEFGKPLFEIEIVDTIDTLALTSTPDEQLKKQIELYINDLSDDIESIS